MFDDEDADEIIEDIELILFVGAAVDEDELRWGMTICSNCWRLLIGVDWCEVTGPWDDCDADADADDDDDDDDWDAGADAEDEDALWDDDWDAGADEDAVTEEDDDDEPGGGAGKPLDFVALLLLLLLVLLLPGESPELGLVNWPELG